jgi:hypothetical protein
LYNSELKAFTELLGSFILEVTYQSRTPPKSQLYVIVLIYLNTTITSRPRDPLLLEVGRARANIYLSAANLQGNHIAFPAFRLDGMLSGKKRMFQVSNMRCNAIHVPEVNAIVTVAGAAVEK